MQREIGGEWSNLDLRIEGSGGSYREPARWAYEDIRLEAVVDT
jgi:hypothetical protein